MSRATSIFKALPGLSRTLHRLKPYVMEYRRTLWLSFLALLGATLLRLLEPWPLKFAIDHVFAHKAYKHIENPNTLLIAAAIAMVVFTTLRSILDYWNRIGFAIVGNKSLRRVRDALYSHIQGLSLDFHNNSRTGDLVVRVVADVNMLKDVLVTAILPLLGSILVVVGMAIVMCILQWKLALLTFVSLPILWIASARTSKRIQEVARKQRKREGAMASTAAEVFAGIKAVQALGLEGQFAGQFKAKNNESQKADVKGTRLSARLERGVDVLVAFAGALVLYTGGKLVIAGQISTGDLVIFLTYLRRMFNPVQDFAKYTSRLAKASAAGERILDVFDMDPSVKDKPDAVKIKTIGDISLKNVSFAYNTIKPVLNGLDLEIPGGKRTALVGPSGIGKSTVANLILRLYDTRQGEVLVDGMPIDTIKLALLRSNISVVLQENLLFSGTIFENVVCAEPNATLEEVVAACKTAHAHEFIERLPLGYETIVGERGLTLSAGQRQRLAIARAALRKSPIVIFDEPTTGLDKKSEDVVLQGIFELANQRTTLLITHDLKIASECDYIAYMDGGQVVEYGTHDELMRLGGIYAAVYRLQNGGAPKTERSFRTATG